MSQHQKENIVSFISLVGVSSVYIFYVFTRYLNQTFTFEQELKYWAAAIFLLIPIRIATQIVLFIMFKITEGIFNNGKLLQEVKDERDQKVEIKGDWISGIVFIIGFMFAMFCVAFLNSTLSAMFAIILVAGYMGEFVGIISKVLFYNKGV